MRLGRRALRKACTQNEWTNTLHSLCIILKLSPCNRLFTSLATKETNSQHGIYIWNTKRQKWLQNLYLPVEYVYEFELSGNQTLVHRTTMDIELAATSINDTSVIFFGHRFNYGSYVNHMVDSSSPYWMPFIAKFILDMKSGNWTEIVTDFYDISYILNHDSGFDILCTTVMSKNYDM